MGWGVTVRVKVKVRVGARPKEDMSVMAAGRGRFFTAAVDFCCPRNEG